MHQKLTLKGKLNKSKFSLSIFVLEQTEAATGGVL